MPTGDAPYSAASFEALFEPLTIGALTLPNRIVMAPMTRYFSPGGVPTEAVAQYYARRAAGGASLLITEGVYIPHPTAHAYSDVPRFYGEDALEGWRHVLDLVHAEGGRIMPQLWHAGLVRELGAEPDPTIPGLAPSALPNITAKAMSEEDIADVIAAYTQAAASAQMLGFDGVEIHGAHGYLIDTFFWERTNLRGDLWGGDLQARARFGAEIVRGIRAAVGPLFPISFRWSQFKQQDYKARLAETPAALTPFLRALSDAGVSMFHASTRRFWEPAFPALSELSLAGWTRRLTGKPTIAVGSVGLSGVASINKPNEGNTRGGSFGSAMLGDPDQIRQLTAFISRGEFDLIAVGRSILADPNWPHKIREGRLADRIPFSKRHLDALE